MEDKNEADKIMDDVMLPGFRFHPTDEELVGFYLKRKIQQRQLPVELIKQVDIYKYDPWDLPKLASTGEKEWYFYCPRDRKYRNSVRPNRVTGAGFWKATGTDRPIYSSDGRKCIGLKKSLVFYRGRAAKGLKTDWMMHEFRLPSSSSESPQTTNNILDNTLPPNDAWAICRIFKKASSIAQRALAHAWLTPHSEPPADILSRSLLNEPFSTEIASYNTEVESSLHHWDNNNNSQHNSIVSSKQTNAMGYKPSFLQDFPNNLMFLPQDSSSVLHTIADDHVSNADSENIFNCSQQHFNNFSMGSSPKIEQVGLRREQSSNDVRFSLPSNIGDAWKPHLAWGSPNCPNELVSTIYE